MAEDEHDYKVGAGTHALQNHQLRETTLLICLPSDAMPVSSASSQRLEIPVRRLLLRRANLHVAAGFSRRTSAGDSRSHERRGPLQDPW